MTPNHQPPAWRRVVSSRARLGRLSIAVIVPLLIGGAAGFVLVDTHKNGPAPSGTAQTLLIHGSLDSFHRQPNPSALGAFPGDVPWQEVAGSWGITGEQAYVVRPTGRTDLAVIVPTHLPAAAQVRVAKVSNNAGLVFRYQDPINYWAVVAVPYYGTWAIVRVLGGQQIVLANTGLSPVGDGTVLAVHLTGRTIDVAIDGRVARRVTDRSLQAARGVGITSSGDDAAQARFADFRVATTEPAARASATPSPSPSVPSPSASVSAVASSTAPATLSSPPSAMPTAAVGSSTPTVAPPRR